MKNVSKEKSNSGNDNSFAVQSRRLKSDYSAKFSIAGKQNMKSFRDVFEELEELIREEVE